MERPVPPPVDVALSDGRSVRIRAATGDDHDRLVDLLARLTPGAREFRFFTQIGDLDRAARLLLADAGLALIATTGPDERVVAHAMSVPDGRGAEEAAFAVDPAFEGQGLATTMLRHLAEVAAAAGTTELTLIVLPSNHRMIDVVRGSGFPVEVRTLPGELEATVPTTLTAEGRARFETREDRAAAAAVGHALAPASVALVGAGIARGTLAGEVLHRLLAGRYRGRVAVVAPERDETLSGVEWATSVEALADAPELALVATRADDVLGVARACADAGVRALAVMSVGVADGSAGRRRTRELLAICRAAGMRLVGPDCLGLVNTDPAVELRATVSGADPVRGTVGLASHSGALGVTALDLARRRGLGLSTFVSLGDRADLSGNDVLRFWERDGRTTVGLLYLESFGNPRRFARIARRLSGVMPVVAVRAGRGAGGDHLPASIVGRLLADGADGVEVLLRQAGVIRARTVAEMLDVATLLTRQPLPAGGRVAVVANARGPGVLCADACRAEGLELAAPDDATLGRLGERGPEGAEVGNPLDLHADASADDVADAVRALLDDDGVDAVVVVFVRRLAAGADDVQRALRAAADGRKPVLCVHLGGEAPGDTAGQAVFDGVEEAARALAHVVGYARDRDRPADPVWAPHDADGPRLAPTTRSRSQPADMDVSRAAALVADALGAGGGRLDDAEAARLLACYGLTVARSQRATTPTAVARAARELGGTVVVKALATGLERKAQAGAVRLDLRTPTAAARAAEALRDELADVTGFLVQEQVPTGPELLVGAVADPGYGPLVAAGPDDEVATLLGDVALRPAPVGTAEAARMLRELKTFPLLRRRDADLDGVADAIARVAALVADQPSVAVVDCDPLIATPRGPVVVDARVLVRTESPRRPYGALR